MITARIILASQNLMFWTALWCIPNIMIEYAPRWLKIREIRQVNIKVHKIAGIFLVAIPSVVHVLLIFVPPLIDRVPLQYFPPSSFNYSTHSDGLNWTKWWDPAAYSNWKFNDARGVRIGSDEIYRLVSMLLLFFFLFPLTLSRFLNTRSYSLAITLHAFAGIFYAADNLRKITHRRAHAFNLPILMLWCIDRFISVAWYRKYTGRIYRHQVIGTTEYVVTYVKLSHPVTKGVGDVYYVTQSERGLPQRAHPLTSFSNHSLEKDSPWDIGFVTSIMHNDEQWFKCWTRKVAELELKTGEVQINLVSC